MSKLPPHVEAYRRGYRYRRRVPADVTGWVGLASWLQIFPAGTPLSEVERVSAELTETSNRQIREGRQRRDVPLENRLAAIEARLATLEAKPQSLRVERLSASAKSLQAPRPT